MSEQDFSEDAEKKGFAWLLGAIAVITVVAVIALGGFWSIEPDNFNIIEEAKIRQEKEGLDNIPEGYVYANTLAHIAETLLYKSGGYITNDVGVPGVYLDNITSWEYGVLIMLRDATSALRNHSARSQSQSAEDPDLAMAEPYFYYEHNSWALPSTEAEYEKGIEALHSYMARLADPTHKNPGHFYS
ncbi:MAG: DUF2333 family protein, partial [Methyloprofundus sp.]|nr:DUF2333 family protein [Methyloprofundus sp.]